MSHARRELPLPENFERAAEMVSEHDVAEAIVRGSDQAVAIRFAKREILPRS